MSILQAIRIFLLPAAGHQFAAVVQLSFFVAPFLPFKRYRSSTCTGAAARCGWCAGPGHPLQVKGAENVPTSPA
jgi:hypothetical protein